MTTSTTTLQNIRTGIIWSERQGGNVHINRNKSFFRKNRKFLLVLLVIPMLAGLTVQFGPRYMYHFWGYLWLKKFDRQFTDEQLNSIQKTSRVLRPKSSGHPAGQAIMKFF